MVKGESTKSKSCCLLLLCFFVFNSAAFDANAGEQSIQPFLEQLVVDQQTSAGLVGLGAVVIQKGKYFGPSVSGERKKASNVALQAEDRWHLGSITKPITATMIARLVEKGELSWDTKIEDVFKSIEGLDATWQEATLSQLLTHTAGAVPNFPLSVRLKRPVEGQERKQARESAVINILKNKPENTPGSTFVYSNVGYTIAGVIAERKTGLVWEELIKREIFEPLRIKSGGFGPPRDIHKELEQPRGHKNVLGFTVATGFEDDNTPIMGPASTIHLSLKDLALFANEHLQGAHDRGVLLKADTYKQLHTKALNRYASGWAVSARKHLGVGSIYWHSGTNKRWYALLAFIPDIDAVIAITSNDGNIDKAKKSAWEIVNQLAPILLKAHKD